MQPTAKLKTLAACCAITLGFAVSVMAEPQDVVNGPDKQPIRSEKFGTCVHTKWESSSDECAPPAAPKKVVVIAPAAPAPEPVTKLEHEALTIYFPFNKSTLTDEDKAKLDKISDSVNNSPHVTKVNIVGYTDTIGSDSYNNKLSVQRADAAKAYLDTKMRIPAGVLGLRGLGKQDPIATGCDKIKKRKEKIACLAKDRRVEIEFEFQQ